MSISGRKWAKPGLEQAFQEQRFTLSPAFDTAFDTALVAHPGLERRQMFGCPCAFLAGNLAAGLVEESMMVRLPPAMRTEALAAGFAPFQANGRTMREYVVLPATVVADPAQLAAWLARAVSHVATLPPKPGRTPRRSPARRG